MEPFLLSWDYVKNHVNLQLVSFITASRSRAWSTRQHWKQLAGNFNFQGAFAYLDRSYVFTEIHVILLDADYRELWQLDCLLALGHRDPSLELRAFSACH